MVSSLSNHRKNTMMNTHAPNEKHFLLNYKMKIKNKKCMLGVLMLGR